MIEFVKCWTSLKSDRRGVTALEYGVIAGVLAVALVTTFSVVGSGLQTKFNSIIAGIGASPSSASNNSGG